MMALLTNPSLRWIGGLFACGAVLLLIATWMINSDDPGVSAYAFPLILIGMVLLFAALAQLALWALNRAQPPGN